MSPQAAIHQSLHAPPGVVYAAVGFVLLLAVVAFLVSAARSFLRPRAEPPPDAWPNSNARTDDASAFAAASMQGVIEKLRAQEKELARLHQLAQERAHESERLTEEVTRNMPTGLLLVNATGAIGSANPAAEQALGIRHLHFRGYKEILGPDSELSRMIGTSLREGRTFHRCEVEHLLADGETRRLGVTISPIFRGARRRPGSTEKKASGALCLLSDLTELAALQKQIRWKESLAALGEMSAGIAHEFKNALATISGYAQMIRGETAPGDMRDSADKLLDQVRALTHVVTEFLRFAKPLDLCFETVPVAALVERVALELCESMPQCQVTCDGVFTDLPGDEALLRQALVNLARNGAESARDSGAAPRVQITGTIEELGGRKWQRICVADNGPGIPERDLPKIFLPFFTTKSEGTGLGLAVVQKVALQHGGSIEARNLPGGGAALFLWLPLGQEVSPTLFPSQAVRI